MKLKRLISLTTAVLMTATLAVGLTTPATAAVWDNYGSKTTFAILRKSTLSNRSAVYDEGKDTLQKDVTETLGIYVFNSVKEGAIQTPVYVLDPSGKGLSEDEFEITSALGGEDKVGPEISSADINAGTAYGDQTDKGSAKFEYYTNGAINPTDVVTSSNKGLIIRVAAGGKLAAKNPATGTADNALIKFNLTLKAGLPKGEYKVAFDLDENFYQLTDKNNNPFPASDVAFKHYSFYVGEGPKEPLTKPSFNVTNVTKTSVDVITDFYNDNGKVTEVIKNKKGDKFDISQGYTTVVVPVTVQNAIGAITVDGKVKVTGKDAGRVALDSAPRFLSANGDPEEAPITAGDVKLKSQSAGSELANANDLYTIQAIFADVENATQLTDGQTVFNLQFIVGLDGRDLTKDSYDFTVELSEMRWILPAATPYAASVDENGVLLTNDSGNQFFSILNNGNVKLGAGVPEPGTTTATPDPGTVTTPKVTTTKGSGRPSTSSDNPASGDSGVVGVIATAAIIGLAGGAVYFARRKRDDE